MSQYFNCCTQDSSASVCSQSSSFPPCSLKIYKNHSLNCILCSKAARYSCGWKCFYQYCDPPCVLRNFLRDISLKMDHITAFPRPAAPELPPHRLRSCQDCRTFPESQWMLSIGCFLFCTLRGDRKYYWKMSFCTRSAPHRFRP